MKKYYYSLIFIIGAAGLAACMKDDPNKPKPVLPEISIENISEITSVGQKDTICLRAVVEEGLEEAFVWSVDGEEAGRDEVFKFVSSTVGTYSVTLSCTNDDGTSTKMVELEVYPQFRHGTFVLNEGNMSNETGTLIFISPQGVVEDSVYMRVNKSQLGNVCQDMFITGGKMYVISQNGKRDMNSEYEIDGRLVKANAETLEKIAAYNEELAGLKWPSNIAALDDKNVFIRDNNGVHLFDSEAKTLTFIEGSGGASKNRMAVVGGKVFVPCGSKMLVLKANQTAVDETVDIGAALRGVIRSSDGNLWAATAKKIMKISAADYSIIKEAEIAEGSVGVSYYASPGITAVGEVLYYSGGSRKIYRYDFAAGTGELLVNVADYVEDAGMQYNDIAVNPVTGQVYVNTIKGFGLAYLVNNISVFDFGGAEPKLAASYKDLTHFPAGIYFTYNFE